MVTRTVRVEQVGAILLPNQGDFLVYQVSFQGESALFAIMDSANNFEILSPTSSPGAPAFSRQWPLPADPVSPVSTHMATFHFLDAVQYTYKVDLHRASGTVTVIDIDYNSTDPNDFFSQSLDVTVLR